MNNTQGFTGNREKDIQAVLKYVRKGLRLSESISDSKIESDLIDNLSILMIDSMISYGISPKDIDYLYSICKSNINTN